MLTKKIKNNPIREIVNVIEAIQSYDFDWEFYLISSEEQKLSSLEKITPIPCSLGGLSFLSFIYDEEKLIEHLPYKQSIKRKISDLLMKGYHASRIIKTSVLESILEHYPEILTHCFFEIAFPLSKENVDEGKILDGLFEEYELVDTEYYYLEPSTIESILEEVYYLHEYLERLSQTYEGKRKEAKGIILLLRGVFPASVTLTELENVVEKNIESIKDIVYNRVLLYNRLISVEKLF